jgi:hypothetical protein
MLFKITHALIAIPNIILIPTDSRTRKSHNQTFRHITTQKDTMCIRVPDTTAVFKFFATLVLGMPEILLQGLISVNFFLSIREIYFHLK